MPELSWATLVEMISMTLGFASSIVLLIWALRLSPLQRSLAQLETIESGSPVEKVGDILAGKLRNEIASILRRETRYLATSAVLLGLSFLCGLVSKMI